jgi:hypothetical protein
MTILAIAAGETLVDFEIEVDSTAVLETEGELGLEPPEVEDGEAGVFEVETWTGQVEAETVEVKESAVEVKDWATELED